MGFCIISLVVDFEAQMFLILMKSSLSIFSFAACAFGVIFKKPLPNKKSQRFTPMLSSKNFVILVTFRPLIHLSWILFVV